MIYIKTYEKYEKPNANDLKIGEYVICQDSCNEELSSFLSKNIGRIVLDPNSINIVLKIKTFKIKYENVPSELKIHFIRNKIIVCDSDILYHSKNKKDLEIILASKKYNI